MSRSLKQSLLHVSILKQLNDLQFDCNNGAWSCPLCPRDRVVYSTEESVKNHFSVEHEKRLVESGGYKILRCNLNCGVLRDKSHYHCLYCSKALTSRGDIIFHLKSHRDEKPRDLRGRRKALATVMRKEAGVKDIQLFSHASLVVSPTILTLIDDHQAFWTQLEEKTGMTCLKDDERQFCVLQGQYDSVLKANSFLEQYFLDKLYTEVDEHRNTILTESAAVDSSTATPAANQNPDFIGTEDESNDMLDGESASEITTRSIEKPAANSEEWAGFSSTKESSANHSSSVRKSSRKRKPNPRLGEYVTSKSLKTDSILKNQKTKVSNSAAIRRSNVAHTLRTKVQQDCHVTLSKNLENGEYQVHMMFPPPQITEPSPIIESLETANRDHQLDPTMDGWEDNPLMEMDDEDEDEDYKAEEEAENTASDEDDIEDVDEKVDVEVKNGSSMIFKCNHCDTDFASISALVKHRTLYHKGADEVTSTAARSYLSGSSSNTIYSCSECEFSTSLKSALKLHVSRQHAEKQLECEDCHERFGPLIDLKTHIKETGHREGHHTNLSKQIVDCKICGKKLQLKNLKMHIAMVHQKLKPFKCEECGKMFGTRFLVREHMESHKNMGERVRPFACSICSQSFFKKLPLDEHMAKHEGKPQYACDQCPKKFYHLSGWKRHLQHHSENRPFHCEVCGKSFKTSTNLSAHKMVHKPVAYMCVCSRTYQQKHTLKTHQEKCPLHQETLAEQMAEQQYAATPARYMCGYCQQTFSNFNIVQEHVKQHVTETVEIGGLEQALNITNQAAQSTIDQSATADITAGSGLDHLAMTAAIEQQNALEGQSFIVHEIPSDQLHIQRLVEYQAANEEELSNQQAEQIFTADAAATSIIGQATTSDVPISGRPTSESVI